MKKIFFALVVFATALTSKAQTDSSYFEVGVNAIRVINLGLGSSKLDYNVWNPYMITAEGHYKRIGLRLGMGMNSQKNTELPTETNGMTRTDADSSRTDFRVGLNWDINMGPKWTFKLGVDYFMAKQSTLYKADFVNEADEHVINSFETKYKEKGFSPVVYIQFHISERISIGTELLWRISTYISSDSDKNSLNENTLFHIFLGSKSYMMAPTSLFLCARF